MNIIKEIFKYLSIWIVLFNLSLPAMAESHYQVLKTMPDTSNKKIIEFIHDFNKARIVQDLIPSVDKYLVDEKNKIFIKNHLRQYMLVTVPKLQLQGDLITLFFEAEKRTVKMRLNLKNSKLYLKGKIIDLRGINLEKLTHKLAALDLVFYQKSFSLINEAHAAIGLTILAVAGIGALIVGVLGLFSSWSKKSCFIRYEDVFRTFETAEINCLNDKASVIESPASKKLTETFNYIQSVKYQMKKQHVKKQSCKNEVTDYFKYFSFFRQKPCIPKNRVGTMCNKMKTLETCLREYEEITPESISGERLRLKLPNGKTNPLNNQNTGQQSREK
jgi:hypothetical protein